MATLGYDTLTPSHRLKSQILAGFLILILAAVAVHGEAVQLTLYPVKVDEPAQTYQLLPSADKQTDADAVPLYEKAIQAIPRGINKKQIQEWLKLPIEQLPQEQAEEVVHKHIESLRFLAQATRCKECNWPEWKPGTDPPDTNGYRDLTFVLRLWARLEMSRGQYKDALVAMQTAFGMAKQLGQAPISLQVQVATAVGEVMCREVNQFIQGKDSPNLYWALANLPRPLVDMERAIENESANLKNYNVLVRRQFEKQLKPAQDRMRMIERRANTRLNALQCLEATRHYAATHDGQLPQSLSDITDMEIPNDLMSGKAFEYRRTATGATLQSAIPEGGNERDTVHYEIVLKK